MLIESQKLAPKELHFYVHVSFEILIRVLLEILMFNGEYIYCELIISQYIYIHAYGLLGQKISLLFRITTLDAQQLSEL